MFLATKSALRQLENSLQCSVCHNLLTEPCTLGNCPHLICKACAGNYAGNACPSCHAPAWAKDLQIKRELGMVVRLCRRLDRLINSDQQDTASIEVSEDYGHRPNEESMEDKGKDNGIGFGLNEGSETEPMSISESDVDGEVGRKVLQTIQKSDTESPSGLTRSKSGGHLGKKIVKSSSKNSKLATESGTKTKSKDTCKQKGVVSKQMRKLLSLKPTSENNPLTVYDFEASPPRPKTRKAKMQVVQQTKREARLKKVAAANKKWDSVSSGCGSRKEGRKHVSFSDDSLKSGSSSADDTGVSSTRGQRTSHSQKTIPKDLTNGNTKAMAAKTKSDNESIANTSPTRVKQSNGMTAVTNQINKSSPKDSKNQKGKKSTQPTKDPSPSKIGTPTTKSCPSLARIGQKRRSSDSLTESSNNKDVSTPPSTGKKQKSVKQSTPETSSRKSPGQKRISGGGSGISPSPNSSFSSPKTALMKRNKRGETPLHVACIKGDEAEVKSLLEQGADPNSKDNAGWTPLHEACNHGHTALLSLLLDHNALINAPGFEHDTPLHDAVNNSRIPVIKFLRERGASLQTRNIHGQTPLDLPATPAVKKALLTQPLSSEVTNSPICTPVTAPSQHLQDRQVVLLATGLKPKEKTSLQKCSDLLDGRVVDEFNPDVTHLVGACEEDGLCLRTMKYMQAVLAGRWVVSFKWVEQCIKHRERVEEVEYEIPGTSADPESNTARRARENIQKQFPGLFSGCHFFFSGTFKHPTPSKAELTDLIKLGGGTILVRQPRPDDDVIQASTVVPYHAQTQSHYASCAYYIIYDHLGKRAPPTVRTPKVCTVPVYWLLDCVSQFTILDPPRE